MKIEIKRLDTLNSNFIEEFNKIEIQFYDILSKSYPNDFGGDYHKDRIEDGKAILYLGFAGDKIIAASYVKRNLRRGGTVVYPNNFRRKGLAKKLIKLSLIDFPKQYTIISTNFNYSHRMLSLLRKIGFKKAIHKNEIKKITGNEYKLISNFRSYKEYFVFDRISQRRNAKRNFLTLLHTF